MHVVFKVAPGREANRASRTAAWVRVLLLSKVASRGREVRQPRAPHRGARCAIAPDLVGLTIDFYRSHHPADTPKNCPARNLIV